MNCRCKHFLKMQYFSGNGHLQKYNICGWIICGEWKLVDVVNFSFVAGYADDVKTLAPLRYFRRMWENQIELPVELW